MRHPVRSAFLLAALVGGLWIVPGCTGYRHAYDPGGSGASRDMFTYWSEPHMPQTVELIDLRTGETLFAVDIPPRQQLVVKFKKNHSEKDAWMPDIMKWDLMPRGDKYSKLDNSMPVPPSFSRRLDVSLRDIPEMPDAPRYGGEMPMESPAAEHNDWVTPAPSPAADPAEPGAPAPAASPTPMTEIPQSEPTTPVVPMSEPVEAPPTPEETPEPVIDLPDEPTAPSSSTGQMTPVHPRG